MADNIYIRLADYYRKVARVLRGEIAAAGVFPNPSDIGISRETNYATFLQQHVPARCDVFLGGFLFDKSGYESSQLDVIVTNDTTPRFALHDSNSLRKSFSPVEGALGVASIKSMLNRNNLFDALDNIASIPPMTSLNNRVLGNLEIKNYGDWPFKIVFAPNGIEAPTLMDHLQQYYLDKSHIPVTRRPHVIHVLEKYLIFRVTDILRLHYEGDGPAHSRSIGDFELLKRESDLAAILLVLHGLQQNATLSSSIMFDYKHIMNNVMDS